MTDPKRTCGNCDYFTAGANGHGTCHVAAPGSIARNGFPIIAAGDWCAKGATGGSEWMAPLIDELYARDDEAVWLRTCVDSLGKQVAAMLARNLWQRICNTVPWEGK